MGPVVLDRDEFEAVLRRDLAGEAGGEELGVEVMGDHVELRPEDPLEVVHGLLQVFERRGVAHVPHVGRSDGKPALVDGRVRVQLGTDAEDAVLSRDRLPSVSGRSPRESRMIYPSRTTESSHRFTIFRLWVRKKSASRFQLRHRDVDLRDHRVTGHVGAGHDQERVREVGEEAVVEPGVGEHAPDVWRVLISAWAVGPAFPGQRWVDSFRAVTRSSKETERGCRPGPASSFPSRCSAKGQGGLRFPPRI